MQAANQQEDTWTESRQEFCSVAPASTFNSTFRTHGSAKRMLAEEEYMQVRVGIFSSVRCVSSPAE